MAHGTQIRAQRHSTSVTDSSTTPAGAQHTKQLQSTLRRAHVARINRDYAQTAILNRDIQRIASSMNFPLCKPVNVTVPYLSSAQHTPLGNIVNRMVRHTKHSAWEPQAIQAHIRIVSSSPLNVRRALERHANKHGMAQTRPPCYCDSAHMHIWQQGGTALRIGAHFALLPLTSTHEGMPVRSTDPLPCSSARSQPQAISGLHNLVRTLHLQHMYTTGALAAALPVESWNMHPYLRRRVRALADNITWMPACGWRARDKQCFLVSVNGGFGTKCDSF